MSNITKIISLTTFLTGGFIINNLGSYQINNNSIQKINKVRTKNIEKLINDNYCLKDDKFWFDKNKLNDSEKDLIVIKLNIQNINQLDNLHSDKYSIWNPINGCTCNSGIPIRYWWGYAFYITSEQCKTALKILI